MLAFDFYAQPVHTTTPLRRSPLGVRDANAWASNGRGFLSASSSSPLKPSAVSSSPSSFSPFFTRMSHSGSGRDDRENENQPNERRRRVAEPRRREGKFAPLLRKRDDRDLRRNTYLSNAKRASEDKLFDARMDQTLMRQYIEERQEWEARMDAQDAAERPILEEAEQDLFEEEEQVPADENFMQDLSMMEPPSDDDDPYQQYLWSQEQPNEPRLPELTQQTTWQRPVYRPNEFWSDDDDFERNLLQATMQAEQTSGWENVDQKVDNMDTDMTS